MDAPDVIDRFPEIDCADPRLVQLNAATRQYALEILNLCPEYNREMAVAITNLETSVLWATKAIGKCPSPP